MSRTRIRLVVLDGLDWEWVSAHLDEHDLRPLRDLAEEGCSAPLRACDAPITPTGVAALLAGREVDVPWVLGDHYATSQSIVRSRPWVHELARNGLTVGLVNVPLTWPAFPLPAGSYVVSGFPIEPAALDPSTGRGWRFPRGLDVLGYPIERIVCDGGPGGTKDVVGLAQAETEIATWLLGRERKDVEVIWLRSTDSAGHHLWGRPEYREAVARAVGLLPRLREGADSVVVVSDHGFDALDSPRCGAYHRTSHGPASRAANLSGGHAMEGILFAAGDDVQARGVLGEQRLVEVAGGLFDLLQMPPPPGMISRGPAWATACGDGADAIREKLKALGYLS